MIPPIYKKQLAQNIGISIRTLQRRLNQFNIHVPRGYISSDLQKEIYLTLGYKYIWEKLIEEYSDKNKL